MRHAINSDAKGQIQVGPLIAVEVMTKGGPAVNATIWSPEKMINEQFFSANVWYLKSVAFWLGITGTITGLILEIAAECRRGPRAFQ